MKKWIIILSSIVIILAGASVLLISRIKQHVEFETYVYEPQLQEDKEIVLKDCKALAIANEYIDLLKEDGSVFRYQKIEDFCVYNGDDSQKASISDLKLGVTSADFVLSSEKKIAKAYIHDADETLSNIRVLIQASDYNGRVHDAVSLTCESQMTIVSGRKNTIIPAGKTISFTLDSDYFLTDRILLIPSDENAVTTIHNVTRAIGTASYRGKFEIAKSEDGLFFMNELPLEQYLVRVVPSEMPSSYPMEALKAQAVCARTYAYMHMQEGSLRAYGAHVDDSTAFQVYGNIVRTPATDSAVANTQGEMLFADDKLCETYFYSTSCGSTSGIAVWHVENLEDYGYLASRFITRGENAQADALAEESTFRQFIDHPNEADYEKEDSFYRWSYSTSVDADVMAGHINDRKQASEQLVSIIAETGEELTQCDVNTFGEVTDLKVTKRLAGGAMDELVITFEHGEVTVCGERNIREVLLGKNTAIYLNNGNEGKTGTLLPSAFAYLDLQYDESGAISGYHITGGGYGHGIGMSQNGAKHMAENGMNYQDILQLFYQGTIHGA